MLNTEMRKNALRRYVVFRVKAMEFIDLNALWNSLKVGQITLNPPIRPPTFLAQSVRTVVLSWFALFVDKNGMNVINLWVGLFPKHAKQIQESWTKMQPTWDAIIEFRDRAGFHADIPRKFFGARNRIRIEPHLDEVVQEFDALLRLVLNSEAQELPDLEGELDSLLEDLGKEHEVVYQNDQLKSYLMLTRGAAIKGTNDGDTAAEDAGRNP